MTKGFWRTLFAFTVLASGTAMAQGITFNPGTYVAGLSAIVPTSAQTMIPAPAGNSGKRFRVVAVDTACLTGATPTVWCAWGTSAANAAVIGSNGFPLGCGFDDSGPGTNQSALNCIQSNGNTHFVRFEAY